MSRKKRNIQKVIPSSSKAEDNKSRYKIYADNRRKKRNRQRYEEFKAKHPGKVFPEFNFNAVPYRYGYRKIGRCKICGRTTEGVCCDRSICKRMLQVYHNHIYHNYTAGNKSKETLRKCKAMEILGYRSKNCDGYIHNGNWSLCQKCIEMRNQRLGVDESGYNYETYQVHI